MTTTQLAALRLIRSVPARGAAVALPVHEGDVAASGLDPALLGRLGFEGRAESVAVLPAADRVVYAVGLGRRDALTTTVLRRAAAAVARAASREDRLVVALLDADTPLAPEAAAAAVVEGLLGASYRYDALRSKPAGRSVAAVDVVAPTAAARRGAERGRIVATATARARDLVNEPGGSLTPDRLARAATAWGRSSGFGVEVAGIEQIRRMRLGGVLGVNRGSTHPPRFVRTRWVPRGVRPKAKLALVGKGITFDTGGMSLKTAAGMMTMKCDMAGAAAVFGATAAIAELGLPIEVRGYVPATDNMTGGDATRPGDVLRIRNGKTIEVLNTDAEGRLILADALCLASEDRPDAIVDLATLTGACVMALGTKIAGLMGNDDTLLGAIEASSRATGEQVWRLPLPPEYRKQYESPVADMKNIGNGNAGALVAGLILSEFVAPGIPWAHLDIAGPAFVEADDGDVTRGGTGFGVRLLVDLAERLAAR